MTEEDLRIWEDLEGYGWMLEDLGVSGLIWEDLGGALFADHFRTLILDTVANSGPGCWVRRTAERRNPNSPTQSSQKYILANDLPIDNVYFKF